MAYLMFVDESGQDRRQSPYEVLAGVAVEDSRVWNLIVALLEAEERFFGMRISSAHHELKAKRLLKRKVVRTASEHEAFEPKERTELARLCIADGANAGRRHIAALGQAKLAYAERVLELCTQHGVRAFASIVDKDAPTPARDFLRKDYAYLFERFYYFLDDQPPFQQGLVIFDELERSQSHILTNQMEVYFEHTATGRLRASRIVPEPLFVHSDLTTMVRVADYVAYIISWAVRFGPMTRDARPGLQQLAQIVMGMRYRAVRDRGGADFHVWSFTYIDDLRPRAEREAEQ